MLTGLWPSASGEQDYALSFDQAREKRVLVIPALFDEANKLRHFTVEVMRRLDAAGVDCVLPDLPGTNESQAPLHVQTLASWRAAMEATARHFSTSHVLAVRGGAMLDWGGLPGLRYAPVAASSQLRGMVRAHMLAAKEAGDPVTREELTERGLAEGITLAGLDLGAPMFAALSTGDLPEGKLAEIPQNLLGGPGLWLRAEPAHDPAQADALAQLVLERLA
ncbi:MAG: hypothetical protein KDE15_06495 [Erythrobacter sp.]|nr:hypothetical protein [Erythrobacter sp.]